MTRRVPATVPIGAIAVLAVGVTSAVIAWRASSASIDAGFWWDDAAPFLGDREHQQEVFLAFPAPSDQELPNLRIYALSNSLVD